MSKILIKFTGVSGAGKSTIAQELKNIFIKKNIKVIDNFDFTRFNKTKRHFLPIIYLFTDIRSIQKFIVFIKIRIFNRLNLKGSCNVFKIYLVRNFMLKRFNSDVYIFDQGEMHQLPFNTPEMVKEKDLNLLFSNLYNNRDIVPIIVFVEVPANLAIQRILKDKKNSAARKLLLAKDMIERKKIFNKSSIKFNAFSRILDKNEKINLIKIDGTEPSIKNAQNIYEEIMKYSKKIT